MTNNFSGLLAAAAALSAVNHPHLPRIWLLLTLTPAWLKSVVYLDESIREASDWDGPGQAGVAQVGVTPLLQLSLTSGQNLQEWDSHNHIHNPQQNNSSCASSLMFRPAPLRPCPYIRPLFFQAGKTPKGRKQ